MKTEYPAEQNHHHHHHHKFHLHTPPLHLRRPSAGEFPPTSEKSDTHHHHPPERANSVRDDALGFPLMPPPSGSDGDTVEVIRRPRGRPPGSKNRPKPPVVVTRDLSSEPSMSPYVLELPPGVDVIQSIARFCRKRGIGLCVLNGNGVVANVTLKQPSTTTGATVTFHGQFDILSISATVFPPSNGGAYPEAAANAPFSISLAGPQGQVVGGLVVGPLVSAGTIYIIAATFNSPSFDRLQTAGHDDNRDGGHELPRPISGGESGGAPLYSCQPADVIWAPAARQQQQQQPPSESPY